MFPPVPLVPGSIKFFLLLSCIPSPCHGMGPALSLPPLFQAVKTLDEALETEFHEGYVKDGGKVRLQRQRCWKGL